MHANAEEAIAVTTPHEPPAVEPRKRSCRVASVIAPYRVYVYIYIYMYIDIYVHVLKIETLKPSVGL
jgi:hypothetical protein